MQLSGYTRFLTALLVLSFIVVHPLLAQIKVSPGKTAVELASKLAGPGVLVTSPVLKCFSQGNGIFKVVKSNLGLDSGIVLTTGRAATIPGFYGVDGYSSGLASSDVGYPGDATLTTLAGQTTTDACTLEFDVTPAGDTISIDYVFSSEEYINAVCGPYNDAFAFFISGPGITGTKNMALVPGTNIPVTINSINNGIPGTAGNIVNCTAMGTGSPFTSYYKDNDTGNTLTHRGLTTILKAIYPVTRCGKYHLKIVIADAGNAKYDSGVFLAAGSLQSDNYKVTAMASPVHDTLAPICVKGCLPGRFKVQRSRGKASPQTIKFITTGTAVRGVDYAPFPDSVVIPAYAASADVVVTGLPTPLNGTKTLQLYLYSPGDCLGLSSIIDSASMVIYDTISIKVSPEDTTICGGYSIPLRVSGDDIYSYSWLPNVKLSNSLIKQPIASPTASIVYTLTAYLPGVSCPFKTATSAITVKLTPSITAKQDTVVCGNASFKLVPYLTLANDYYSYGWSGPGFSSTEKNPLLSNVTKANEGVYHLQVIIDSNGCSAGADIAVRVNIVDTPELISPAILCQYTPSISLNIAGGNVVWYDRAGNLLGANSPILPTDTLAVYYYKVAQKIDNCESRAIDYTIEVKKCCDGTIYIPNAFTPNGDGHNDRFRPLADYGYYIKHMAVYNRWGQVIYSGNEGDWDGYFGATAADAGTYFYKVIFGCIIGGNIERVGEVTLIR